MSKWLKQSTAASIIVGPFIAETDGYTSSESLTALSGIMFKHNAASTTINPTTATHTASGYYNVALAAGSTDTVGALRFAFSNSASHLPVWEDFMVVTASAYDALVAGTDLVGAELAASGITASTFGGGAIDAAAVAASTITAIKIATGAITNDNLEGGLITSTEIATGAIDADAIAASAITSAKIATDAIVADVIGTGAITADGIAASAITSAKIATGAIVADVVGASVIVASTLAANSIHSAAVAPSAIDTGKIAAGAIDGWAIAASAITACNFGAGAIDGAAINASALTSAKFATDAIVADVIGASAIGATETDADLYAKVASAVWDEALTNATHNVGYSAGQRLRYLILAGDVAQSGSANGITLAATEPASDNIFSDNIISIVSGTGLGQTRLIVSYDGTSKVAKVDSDWATIPSSDSVYEVLPFAGVVLSDRGVVTGGGPDTVTLAGTSSSINDTYIGSVVFISSGTGEDQARVIVDYDGPTKVASVSDAWTTVPSASSVYKILPIGRTVVDSISPSGISSCAIAACSIGAPEISATGANKIADHTMRREWGTAASSVDGDAKAGRSLLGAVAKLVNRIADSSGSLIVYEADDSTSLFTQDITADGTACPITELDTN